MTYPFFNAHFLQNDGSWNQIQVNHFDEQRGRLISAATLLDETLKDLIQTCLLHEHPNEEMKTFIRDEIFSMRQFDLGFIRLSLSKIMNLLNIDEKIQKELIESLNDFFMWRNAFAHGIFEYNSDDTVFLRWVNSKGEVVTTELNQERFDKIAKILESLEKNLMNFLKQINKK